MPTSSPVERVALRTLLTTAVSTGDVQARFDWYKAIAKASPYWTRQQNAYGKWGPQATELQPVTPWRAMSHILEAEHGAPPYLAQARLCLELIDHLQSPRDLLSERFPQVLDFANRRVIQNISEVIPHAAKAQEYFRAGARSGKHHTQVRRAVLGKVRTGKPVTLQAGKIRDLVRDARPWLWAVRQEAEPAPMVSGDALVRYRICVPFLDSAEINYVLSPAAGKSWRSTATWIMQRRLRSFEEKPPRFMAIFEYAFGRAEAQRARDRLPGPKGLTEKNPITPDAPRYSTG